MEKKREMWGRQGEEGGGGGGGWAGGQDRDWGGRKEENERDTKARPNQTIRGAVDLCSFKRPHPLSS